MMSPSQVYHQAKEGFFPPAETTLLAEVSNFQTLSQHNTVGPPYWLLHSENPAALEPNSNTFHWSGQAAGPGKYTCLTSDSLLWLARDLLFFFMAFRVLPTSGHQARQPPGRKFLPNYLPPKARPGYSCQQHTEHICLTACRTSTKTCQQCHTEPHTEGRKTHRHAWRWADTQRAFNGPCSPTDSRNAKWSTEWRMSRGWGSRDGQSERPSCAPRYLDSHTVVGHGDARVAVPAHVHGCVGTVVALPVQGATGRVYVIFGLLFYRDLIRGSWGRRIRQRFKKTVREKLAFLWERMAFGFFLSCNGPVLKYSLNVTAELLVLAPIAQLCLGQLTPQCGGEKTTQQHKQQTKPPHFIFSWSLARNRKCSREGHYKFQHIHGSARDKHKSAGL